MELETEGFMQPEVAVVAGAVALLGAPVVRRTIRRALVYGLAGLLTAGQGVRAGVTELGADIKDQAGQRTRAARGHHS